MPSAKGGTTYAYYLQAVNSAGEAGLAAASWVTVPILAPQQMQATQNSPGGASTQVTWQASDGALTWCFAGLGAVAMAAGLAYLALAPDTLLADLRTQNPDIAGSGISDRMIIIATFVMGGAVIVWAIAAMVLAALLFRGVSWSRVLLMISNVGALGLLGLGALGQLVLMVPFLAAALTMTLLLRPETAAWVRR